MTKSNSVPELLADPEVAKFATFSFVATACCCCCCNMGRDDEEEDLAMSTANMCFRGCCFCIAEGAWNREGAFDDGTLAITGSGSVSMYGLREIGSMNPSAIAPAGRVVTSVP